MQSMLAPLVAAVFGLGLSMVNWQVGQQAPGAGTVGYMEARAVAAAQQAEVFGAACLAAATGSPGLISSNLAVPLPAGVAPPAGGKCMTTTAGAGRNVYAYMTAVPGAAGQILQDSQGNAQWFRVQSTGIATNLMTGRTGTVPASIPLGSLLTWVTTSN
ncbi:hypothetical protein AWV80_10420 [Cupriavidus sp. UYMU48A]|nr:hypothetical protein AWV80_10420 [Cupriavidus sp. UYMU48A]